MAKQKSGLGRFFGFLWRALAIVYGLFMFLSLFMLPIFVYFLVASNGPPEVEQDTALVWAPVGNLIEQRTSDAATEIVGQLFAPQDQETVVYNLVKSLDKAASDPRIQMAFLKLDEMGAAGAGQLQDLAEAINRFKQSGKRVVAWSPTYNQSQYYLAAQADEVYLDPLGFVFLEGYGVFNPYFKEALDKLGVKINVFRVGEYKSFVEPFTRNDMSPQARAANRAWLNSIWTTYKEKVAPARQLDPAALESYIATFDQALVENNGDAAQVALKAGLVTQILPLEAVHEKMRERVGKDDEHGSFRQINNYDYLRAVAAEANAPGDSKISMVVVEGPIVDGESSRGSVGGDTIARLISDVRRDDHAAALLLRVNSPGGSLFASETIRREVELTRDAGKPVVVSMAGVAASGGYWISMDADKILAQTNTITGSLGVFGIVPTVSEPLKKLGIHTDGLGTTELSGALRVDQPLSPQVKRILQSGIEHAYSEFITKVAEARGMSVAAVDRIAQGRVWSGADAERIGLVDAFGGLPEAIAQAAELAGLQPDDYELEIKRQPTQWGEWLNFFSSRISTQWLAQWSSLLPESPVFNWISSGLNDPRGIYAHCFCEPAAADSRP